MFELDLSIEGNKKESVKLARFGKEKIPNLKRGIDKATLRLERTIKKKKLSGQLLNVGRGRHGGHLRASFHSVAARYQAGVGIYGLVGSNAVYARIHEVGGIIRAKNAKYLHFKTRDGHWHKVKEVKIKPKRYAESAMREDRRGIAKDIITEVMRPLR